MIRQHTDPLTVFAPETRTISWAMAMPFLSPPSTARLAKKHGAVLVPCQRVFTDACKRASADYWIWDGIHPTYSGHQLLADAWIEAVRKAKWGK